jgi:hypothetical protein
MTGRLFFLSSSLFILSVFLVCPVRHILPEQLTLLEIRAAHGKNLVDVNRLGSPAVALTERVSHEWADVRFTIMPGTFHGYGKSTISASAAEML